MYETELKASTNKENGLDKENIENIKDCLEESYLIPILLLISFKGRRVEES